MYKEILVTGGAGFIGSNLVFELQSIWPNSNITVFDKFNTLEKRTNSHFKYFGDFKNLKGFNGKVISGDLYNDSDIIALLKNKFDVIFHQGAISDTTVLNQAEVIQTNTNSLSYFLDYCSNSDCKLIYASSAGTYGNSPSPNCIGSGENPENVYGFSKLMMDQMVRSFIIKNPDVKVVGLRYFNVYGPGELYKRKTSSMILQLAKQVIDAKKIKLFKYGEQSRDFIYIKDVVQANIMALNGNSGIYNVGTGISRSFNDIVAILSGLLNVDIEIDFIDNPYTFYQNNTCADISLSTDSFGYKPTFTLEMGIKEYLIKILEYSSNVIEKTFL